MNPVFYALCIIVGVFIWACCAFMFKRLGSVLTSIFGDAIKEMSDEDENNKNEGENKAGQIPAKAGEKQQKTFQLQG